jgi:cell division cycle protein 20 (cofactor of APC complex)
MSPDGTTVISAAADETLRLWKCFSVDKQQKTVSVKQVKDTNSKKSSVLRGTIR